jgi:hypothetical protein
MDELKLSPLPKGGRRFLPITTTRKRREVQFETFKNLNMPKNYGRRIQHHALAYKFTLQLSKV